MQIDIRPIIQRLLVLGIPLLSASCGRDGALGGTGGAALGGRGGGPIGGMIGTGGGIGGSGPGGTGVGGMIGTGGGIGGTAGTGVGGSSQVGNCVGGWGTDMMIGTGCFSGPYHFTRNEYRLLDDMDAQQLQRYLACSETRDCADFAEICRAMLAKKYPIMTSFTREDATLTSCEPACKETVQPGVHIVFNVTGSCEGRRPAGLSAESEVRAGDPAGVFFAEAARLEAASVPAFAHLARELQVHGAPPELVEGALAARHDEVRHTRQMRALARRFGAIPVRPRIRRTRLRSLEAMTRENAIEGCVRETYGALVAWWQAIHAEDAVVRSTMRQVAIDETRHAALAYKIHAWALEQLSTESRRGVDEVQRKSFQDLSDEVARGDVPEPAIRQGGYPSTAASMWLVENLRRELA